jgi:hypothetical protein
MPVTPPLRFLLCRPLRGLDLGRPNATRPEGRAYRSWGRRWRPEPNRIDESVSYLPARPRWRSRGGSFGEPGNRGQPF